MEEVLVPLGFFGLVGFVVHVLVSGVVRTRMMSKQALILTRMLEAAGPGEQGTALLASPAARGLLEGRIDRRTVMLDRVISGVSACIVLTVIGSVLLLMPMRFAGEEDRAAISTLGIATMTLGAGFLLAAGAAFVLSRRWGLLEEPGRT